jgi:DNA-directed RNA polymerase subunit L
MISSKYDLIVIYFYKGFNNRVIKIDDYIINQTVPIISPKSKFVVTRKSKFVLDTNKELYNYGYRPEGVYIIDEPATENQIAAIELEKIKLNILEDAWMDIITTIEQYKSSYLFNPLIEHLIKTDRDLALNLSLQHPIDPNSYIEKTINEIDIQEKLTKEGIDELSKRCYTMFCEIYKKIQESDTPVKTFESIRNFYWHPNFWY